MELILDTCGLLSLAGLAERPLSRPTLAALEEADHVYVLSCSLFEIAIKHKKGNIELLPFNTALALWDTAVKEYDLTEIPISGKRFFESACLDDFHGDPFDRIIIAEALRRRIPVVTYDAVFDLYGVETFS